MAIRDDLTVVYYTSNRERRGFERKIRYSLLRTMGDLPLVSVSQKPLNFGHNICVGDVGVSEINSRRQFLIGATEAKTKYICVAEADFLYPKEYFSFQAPSNDALYLVNPVYILFVQRGKRCVYIPKKRGCEGAMVAARDYVIDRLTWLLNGAKQWHDKQPGEDRAIPQLLENSRWRKVHMSIPAVTFKTDYQLHRRTPFDIKGKTLKIPYWGESHQLARRYT